MKNKDNILSAVKDSMRIDKVMKKENLFNKIGEKNKSEMEKQEDKETSDTEGKSLVTKLFQMLVYLGCYKDLNLSLIIFYFHPCLNRKTFKERIIRKVERKR